MAHFSDAAHMDPCRRCRGLFTRDAMTPAAKVLGVKGARGRYCATCAPLMRPGTRVPEMFHVEQ